MDLKEIEILGDGIDKHWYYQSKARAMTTMLKNIEPKAILDVGAGSAFFSKYLLANSAVQAACCVDISYKDDSNEKYSGKPIEFRQNIAKSDADLILMMDVLEHVDNDAGLLADYASKVARGTYFLLTVPAFKFLWSGHDIFLEHKRRYTISSLKSAIAVSGLSHLQSCYFYGSVFPIAAATRLLGRLRSSSEPAQSQLKQYSSLVNKLLTKTCALELPWMLHNRIAGLSVFCLAQKT